MNFKAYIYLSITALFWGANSVAGKIAVGHVSPMLLTGLRWLIVSAIAIAFVAPQIRRDWVLIRRHAPLLLGYGVVGFTAFNAFLYSALQYTSTINVVIEQAGIPMLIFLCNFVLFRTPVTPLQIVGFVLTLSGVALTASHGNPASLLDLQFNEGDMMMLAAVLVYAVYTVGLRWKPAIHWQSLFAVSAAGAFLAAIPLVTGEWTSGRMIWPDTTGWLVVAYAAMFPSFISQVFYVWGVDMIGANRAGLFINAIPIFGTLLSVLLVGEQLQHFHLIALGLVLGGIAIAEKGRPRPIGA